MVIFRHLLYSTLLNLTEQGVVIQDSLLVAANETFTVLTKVMLTVAESSTY